MSCGRPRGGCSSASEDLTHRRPEQVRGAGVAIVPEGRRLLPGLTVEDNLRVATYALDRAEAKAGIEQALELFPELERRWKAECRLLSGGEQQMVVLAQALVSHPKVILVDELSLGLAPVVVKRLAPALEAVAASGVGVLLIEQFAHVALGLAKTAYVLEGGRIRYHGTAQVLKEDPELLRSAYLLREVAGAPGLEEGIAPPSDPATEPARATRDLALAQLSRTSFTRRASDGCRDRGHHGAKLRSGATSTARSSGSSRCREPSRRRRRAWS